MVQKEFNAGGLVVFWSTHETDRSKLESGLKELGLEKHTPGERTNFSALKDALSHVYTGSDRDIKPLKDDKGFEVIKIGRGDYANSYEHIATFELYDGTSMAFSSKDAQALELSAVRSHFNLSKTRVDAASASGSLTSILDAFNGTRVRPRGAIYWLSENHHEEWKKVAKVFEEAGAGNAVYEMTVKHDAAMVRVVCDAITLEVCGEAERMEAEIGASGDDALGERALKTRKDSALRLRKKVAEYEALLGQALPKLTTSLEQVEMAATAATLQLSAAQMSAAV